MKLSYCCQLTRLRDLSNEFWNTEALANWPFKGDQHGQIKNGKEEGCGRKKMCELSEISRSPAEWRRPPWSIWAGCQRSWIPSRTSPLGRPQSAATGSHDSSAHCGRQRSKPLRGLEILWLVYGNEKSVALSWPSVSFLTPVLPGKCVMITTFPLDHKIIIVQI